MESQFRQPKKVINVEVNRQSIARVFDVLYCSVGLRLKSDVLKRGPPSTYTARASPVWVRVGVRACAGACVCLGVRVRCCSRACASRLEGCACVRSSLLFEWGGRSSLSLSPCSLSL